MASYIFKTHQIMLHLLLLSPMKKCRFNSHIKKYSQINLKIQRANMNLDSRDLQNKMSSNIIWVKYRRNMVCHFNIVLMVLF